MTLPNRFRHSAVGLCAIALAVTSTAGQARGDNANPLFALVDAATQRLQTAEPVAASKWNNGGSIEDPARVKQVLAAVSRAATTRDIDPQSVRQIFTDQVNATEAIEYTRFGQWKLDPGSAPGTPPDLASSRATIDRLNTEMVDQIALQWPVLNSPGCAATLDDAKTAVMTARTLDPGYQQALTFSTHSYCAH
ncbi:MAG: chorismate mutase [Mycobacterium sp.]